jgi:hypothetical protein
LIRRHSQLGPTNLLPEGNTLRQPFMEFSKRPKSQQMDTFFASLAVRGI